MLKNLLDKYDVPVPRYTSYPTVPMWEDNLSTSVWLDHVRQTMSNEQSSWSMYFHIPFCESLCTFCGCNNIITKNHKVEDPYIELLHKEWEIYLEQTPALKERPLQHLHLGGGSPTFLSAASLGALFQKIFKDLKIQPQAELSVEVDPRRMNEEQFVVLKEYGFNRISLGVQDFDPHVQGLINRHQPYELTKQITEEARRRGFHSINFDLIYGLPAQTKNGFFQTALKTLELRPDRIALYSFALVPWIKPAQRLFKDSDLPRAAEKRELYEVARALFLENGYVEIGMDHFALKEDGLALAQKEQRLHRNFMGYTDQKTDLLLALGVSGISETPFSFHQNEKLMPKYEGAIRQGVLPTLKGHVHSLMDRHLRQQILDLTTRYVTSLNENQLESAHEYLNEMLKDELVEIKNGTLRVTTKGRPFLRNACVFFDEKLKSKNKIEKTYSQSI